MRGQMLHIGVKDPKAALWRRASSKITFYNALIPGAVRAYAAEIGLWAYENLVVRVRRDRKIRDRKLVVATLFDKASCKGSLSRVSHFHQAPTW